MKYTYMHVSANFRLTYSYSINIIDKLFKNATASYVYQFLNKYIIKTNVMKFSK